MTLTSFMLGSLMDYAPIAVGFILLSAFSVIVKMPWFKGVFGEFLVRLMVRLRLNKQRYHSFHNLMLPTPDGTTQIDHVLVSKYGIVVVETKNMKGWIFGSPEQATWTQQNYEHKNTFQNPLRQNYKHVKALENLLNLPETAFHSLVVFVGDSTFKTPMPENVTHGGGFVTYVRSKTQPILTEARVVAAVKALESNGLRPAFRSRREGVKRLQSRKDSASAQLCPKSGSAMVLRTSKKGAKVGGQFWGCSGFPRSRATRRIA